MTRPQSLSLRCLVMLGLLLLTAHCLLLTAFGQSATATLSGTVEDANGAVVPGASITLVNNATSLRRQTTTNGEGYFTVPLLPPGTYTLKTQHDGFVTANIPDLVLNVGDQKTLEIHLKTGDIKEVVNVTNEAPLINESPAVGTVIDRKFVENLPLNGRSFNTLLQLTPGVVIAAIPANGGVQSPGQFSIAGQRTDSNNFTVDGVSANFGVIATANNGGASGTGSAQAFSALGSTSSLVSVEDLQEFRIETSTVAPELGRASGGQVMLTTRAGTNDFHGGVFEYFRNDVLDANDWFANAAAKSRAPERHNDFGGFLGGPIVRKKTFFFFTYEGARLRLPQTLRIQVPSMFARSSAPAALAPFLNAYPLPDDKSVTTNVFQSTFTGVWSNKGTLNASSIRIDHTFSERFSIFGRYNDAPSELVQRNNSLSTSTATTVNTRTLTFGFNTFISNRMSNSFRANYSTQKASGISSLDAFGGAVLPPSSLFFGPLSPQNNLMLFSISGVSTNQWGPSARNSTRQLNFVDDFSFAIGAHQTKYGVDYRVIDLHTQPQEHTLVYILTGVQAFLNSGGKANFLQTGSTAAAKLRAHSLSLYAQDTWKISPRVTITYGLRWELEPAPSALGATTIASWTNVTTPSQIALAPAGTRPWATRYGNFAPRAGFAWALRKGGDLVVRGGVGVFYDLGVGTVASLASFFPNTKTVTLPNVQLPLSDPTPLMPTLSTAPPFGAVSAFAPNLKLPRSYQWNLALEKSFTGKQVITATYVGQSGKDLFRQEGLFQPNSNFSSTFVLTQNDARSNYNALQLQFRRPLSTRLQAIANYTWSHSLDNASNDIVSTLSNTVISAANDYASSNFDVRHSFSGALTYALPAAAKSGALSILTRNWFIDSVIVARSGFPFNGQINTNFPGLAGFVVGRPDLVPGQPIWIESSSVPGGKSLNPNAFVAPSTVRQGNESRNDIAGFSLAQIDLSMSRKFKIFESTNLQFRADVFNVFNHPNFRNPSGFFKNGASGLQSTSMLNQGLGGLNPLFQEGGPRSIQFSARLTF